MAARPKMKSSVKFLFAVLGVAFSGFAVTWLGKDFFTDTLPKFFTTTLVNWLSTSVPIVDVIGIAILGFGTHRLWRRLRSDSTYTRQQRQLMQFNKQYDEKNQMLYRWSVYFNFSGRPFIADLDIYCTKHGNPPIKLLYDGFSTWTCMDPQCDRKVDNHGRQALTNYIESCLIEMQDQQRLH